MQLSDLVGRTIMNATTRVHIEGLERPLDIEGPLLVVSNHASNADGPLLVCWLTPALGRRMHLLGKQEAMDRPLLGWALAQNGVIGVRRGAADLEAFRAAKRVLDEGHVLGAFPEGTRSPDGCLQPAKDGAAILALRTGAPILPVGLSGTHRFWPRGKRLFRPGGQVRMRVGTPFTLPRTSGGDRRRAQAEATRLIMTKIAELLPPSQRGVYAAEVDRVRGE
ncbi:MAG: 1-acyl-sn-glycerol-3-phosphate acyltransferase [Chloroflexi bacterium]|nr:1-acyl-sn-glycerol-3-phosphate acyltransferase [Chloroflexota bacterium]